MRRLSKLLIFALTTLLIAAALVIALLVWAGGSPTIHVQYRTLPRPTLKNTPLKPPAPNCGGQHTLGDCLPQPKPSAPPATTPAVPSTSTTTTAFTSLEFVASTPSITGPDLSNNNPVYSSTAWNAIARHSRFVYLKSVEGTGYYDQTAAPMAAQAKAHGLPVGGYDFQHVCGDSAAAEAAHFVASLRAQHLLGKGTLPPAADSEYGNGSCGGRVWLQTWVDTVYRLDGHVCPITYTGAWWWQPNIGAWWPTCNNVQLKSWVSGYNVSYPYMPAGISHLDIWQFSDRGYNGYNNTDLSIWHGIQAAFAAFAGAAKPDPYAIFPAQRFKLAHGIRASERNTVRQWDKSRCANPVRRAVCKSSRYHLSLLRDRDYFVATHRADLKHVARPARWGLNHLGARYQGISRRLTRR